MRDLHRHSVIVNYASERLVREAVREILKTNVRSASIQRETYVSDWDLALAYSTGSKSFLTEAQTIRGKIICENVLKGLISAAAWIGSKLSSKFVALDRLQKSAQDAVARALTATLSKIPGGKEAFQLLNAFTTDSAKEITDKIKSSLKEFASYIVENADKILAYVLKSASIPDIKSGILSIEDKSLKELEKTSSDKIAKVKEFFENIFTNPVAAVAILFSARKMLANVAKEIFKIILDKSEKVKQTITNAILKLKFFTTQSGRLVMRLMSVMSVSMSDNAILQAGIEVWNAIKGLKAEEEISPETVSNDLKAVLPDMIAGLASGEGAIEQIVRSAVGDPTAAVKLLKNAIGIIFKVLNRVLGSNMSDILKKINIDPESDTGKAVSYVLTTIADVSSGKLKGAMIETSIRRRRTNTNRARVRRMRHYL